MIQDDDILKRTLKFIITVPNIKISLCVAPITTAIRLQR